MKHILFVFCFLLAHHLTAQKRERLDSLLRIEKHFTQDTIDVKNYIKAAQLIRKINYDSALFYCDLAIKTSLLIKNNDYYARSVMEKFYTYKSKISPGAGIDSLRRYYQDDIIRNEKKYFQSVCQELGAGYRKLGEFDKSITFLFEALKLAEELNDNKKKFNAYNSLANTYSQSGNIKKFPVDIKRALDYYDKAFEFADKGNKSVLSMISNNQGSTWYNFGLITKDSSMLKKSLLYHTRALAYRIMTKDSSGLAESYNNIGSVCNALSENFQLYFYLDEGLKNYEQSVCIARKIKSNLFYSYYSNYGCHLSLIGRVRNNKDLTLKAITILKGSAALSDEVGDLTTSHTTYENLALTYENIGQMKEAIFYYHKYMTLKDTLLKEENKQVAEELAAKYESDLKETENNNLRQQAELREEVISKKSNTIKLMIAASIIMLALIVMVFLSRQKINKSRELIKLQQKETENQKLLIEEKQKEILDSINYSKRLQDAAIPSLEYFRSLLPQSFVFYKPKDIVAGDFYWIHELVVSSETGVRRKEDDDKPSTPNSKLRTPNTELQTPDSKLILLAAADCTGHGVPGALVSIVCLNALNRCVEEFGLIQPAKILDKASEIIQQSFRQSENDVKDGMDIALCLLDLKNKKGYYAGAHNPVWILNDSNIKEIKGDNQPVGQQHIPKPFSEHEFEFSNGDLILIATDGYSDQFGGSHGKKLKTKKFKEAFHELNKLEINEVHTRIATMFENWKGNHEQVDDVLVIGIRV